MVCNINIGKWAALFGLLNIATRPLGGIISDMLYKKTNVNIKKYWMLSLGIIEGIFCLVIGFLPNLNVMTLIGVMSGLAIAMEAGNGANYALVPHLNPSKNGLVSGVVGAFGNLGGIIFGLVFRYNHLDYTKSMWISGLIILGFHLLVIWIPVKPVRKIN